MTASVGLLSGEGLVDLAGDPEVVQEDSEFSGESDEGLFLSSSGSEGKRPLLEGAGFS